MVAVVMLLAASSPGFSQAPTLDQLRAAFIYRFTQFVNWPDSLRSDRSPVVVGLLGADDLRPALEQILDGKQLDGRRYQVRVFDRPEEVRGCMVVFVDLPAARQAGALESVSADGVLTIGNGEEFVHAGGVIALIEENRRIRFDINLTAAQKARLRVQSALLDLARRAGRW